MQVGTIDEPDWVNQTNTITFCLLGYVIKINLL